MNKGAVKLGKQNRENFIKSKKEDESTFLKMYKEEDLSAKKRRDRLANDANQRHKQWIASENNQKAIT